MSRVHRHARPFRRLLAQGALALLFLVVLTSAWFLIAPGCNRVIVGIGTVYSPAAVRTSNNGGKLTLTYQTPRPRPYHVEIEGIALHAGRAEGGRDQEVMAGKERCERRLRRRSWGTSRR